MFLLLMVIVVWDMEEGFFRVRSFRKGVEGGKGTGATLVGEGDGRAGCDVGHSEREMAEGHL
jgi:hypothetical protein